LLFFISHLNLTRRHSQRIPGKLGRENRVVLSPPVTALVILTIPGETVDRRQTGAGAETSKQYPVYWW
jgi:hypothetical protein